MVKKSKRLNSLLKCKSVIKKPSIRRKSKRNIRFIKRGGEIDIQEVAKKLNEITELRAEKGDFEQVPVVPLKEFQEGLERDPLTGKLTEESLEKLLAYHQAKGTGKSTDLATWVNFAKQHNNRDISSFTDDIIMILLRDYDFNSVKMIFMKNLFDLKPSMIQQYLPSSMWTKFGGVERFTSWISKMVDPILSEEPEVLATPKLPITKDTLSIIMTQLRAKYPGINSEDPYTNDLILKDLFKKIYYLQSDDSCKGKLQPGGRPFSITQKKKGIIVVAGVCFMYGSVLMGTAALIAVYIVKTPPEENKDYIDKYSDIELKQQEFLRSSEIMMLTRGIKPFGSFFSEAERSWKGKLPKSEKHRRVADEKSYQDVYVAYKIAEYENREAALRNKMDELEQQAAKDIALMSQGIRPTSDLFKEAQLQKLKKKTINGVERQVATSDAYKSEFDAFQAKKTSGNVFHGLFSGFGL